MGESGPRRLLTGRLALLLTGVALTEASRTMTMVQVPVYLRELGAEITDIGLFFTLATIFPLLLRILGGWISDSAGRLRTLAFGGLFGLAAYTAFALAPSWQMALLGPAFLALTTALVFPSYRSYLAEQAPKGAEGRIFGINRTVITISWVVGPPIGGFLAEGYGYRTMFAVAVGFFALAAAIFVLMYLTQRDYEVVFTQPLSLTTLRASMREMVMALVAGGLLTWIIIGDGIRDVTFKLSFDLMPIYINEIAGLSKQDIGLLDGIFGLALAMIGLPAGVLIDRTSERFAIVLGLLFLITSRVVFAFSLTFWGFALSWSLLAVGAGLMDPAYNSLVAKGIPAHMRGTVYGLVATSLGIVSLPSPWIGSHIWETFGPRVPFLVTAALGGLSIIPVWKKLVLPAETEVAVREPALSAD